MFSDELIEAIRDRALEVYESELGCEIDTRRDPNAICPFHNDSSPSLYVNPDGLWYCQPCGQGGDVFRFLELFRGTGTFVDAVKAAAEILALPLPDRRSKGWDPRTSVDAIRLRQNAKRIKARIRDWHSTRLKELVVRAHDLERTSSRLWQWAVINRIPQTDSLWDKCVQWASEAKMLDEERRVLGEMREFVQQLDAFEVHHGSFTPRIVGLSQEAWQNVRRYLVTGVEEGPGGGGRGPRREGPGLFGVSGKSEGDHRPEHVEAGEVEHRGCPGHGDPGTETA